MARLDPGASGGGQVVAAGTPEQIAAAKRSYTAAAPPGPIPDAPGSLSDG